MICELRPQRGRLHSQELEGICRQSSAGIGADAVAVAGSSESSARPNPTMRKTSFQMSTPITASGTAVVSAFGFTASPVHRCRTVRLAREGKQPIHPISGHFLGRWLLLLLGRERPLDRSVHPAAEGIDVDIRVGGRRETHLFAERLATNRRVLCAPGGALRMRWA